MIKIIFRHIYNITDIIQSCCFAPGDVAKKYGINKYPTIKVFKNGKVQKREYRGSRSKEAFMEYIGKQMESPVKEIANLDDIPDLLDVSMMIAYE